MSAVRLNPILKNEENLNEKQLNDHLIKILKSYYRFFIFRFIKSGSHVTGEWEFNDEEISRAQLADGKYGILSTDDNLDAKEVVNEYFGKDFVEKRFQKMKSGHELMPVRHRLEHRVRSYIFLNMLALRINTVIFLKFRAVCPEKTEECVRVFLKKMSRVERTEVKIGSEIKTIFLNLTPELQETLKLIGFSHLFKQDQMGV